MANSGFSTIRLRRDTTTNWTTGTKNLAYGEIGIDVTTGKLKFGNSSGSVQAWADAKNVAVIQADSATLATTATNIAGGLAGSLPYQSSAGTTTFLAVGVATAGSTVLLSGGVPTWGRPKLSSTFIDATTASDDVLGVVSDATGTNKLVFSTGPSLTSPVITTSAIFNTSGSGTVTVTAGSGSGSYTLSLPNESGTSLLTAATAASTYVGIAGTQTVTGNKTLSGTTVVSGSLDASSATVKLSGITSAGSVIVKINASTGALSSGKVDLAAATDVSGFLTATNGGLGANPGSGTLGTGLEGARSTLRLFVQQYQPTGTAGNGFISGYTPAVGDVWFW